MFSSPKFKLIAGGIGLFLVSIGASYFIFSSLKNTSLSDIVSPTSVSNKRASIDTSGPKTEVCPLNGKKYTKAEKDIWTTRRPLNVMIENHEDSRPQSGLSSADVVYEAVAEGGISRFMAVFYCGVAAKEIQVGPVRSARVYFMDWASEYGNDPLYAHVGGANKPGPADALGNVKKFGWDQYNDLNQFSIGFPTYWRDYERLGHPVATEHTMYSTTDKLYKYAADDRGLTDKNKQGEKWDVSFVPWKFTDGQASSSPAAEEISFPFSGGYDAYKVAWTYDPSSNTYTRKNGNQSHTDFNTDQPLGASNVVVQFTKVKGPIDELKHMLHDTTGTGKALIFQNGNVVEATWSKKSRTDRTVFTAKGQEVTFVGGPIWIEVLDPSTKVQY